jgi:hypothetical protein
VAQKPKAVGQPADQTYSDEALLEFLGQISSSSPSSSATSAPPQKTFDGVRGSKEHIAWLHDVAAEDAEIYATLSWHERRFIEFDPATDSGNSPPPRLKAPPPSRTISRLGEKADTPKKKRRRKERDLWIWGTKSAVPDPEVVGPNIRMLTPVELKKLGKSATRVYRSLERTRRDRPFFIPFSVARLAERLDMSYRTVKWQLAKLRSAGAIQTVWRKFPYQDGTGAIHWELWFYVRTWGTYDVRSGKMRLFLPEDQLNKWSAGTRVKGRPKDGAPLPVPFEDPAPLSGPALTQDFFGPAQKINVISKCVNPQTLKVFRKKRGEFRIAPTDFYQSIIVKPVGYCCPPARRITRKKRRGVVAKPAKLLTPTPTYTPEFFEAEKSRIPEQNREDICENQPRAPDHRSYRGDLIHGEHATNSFSNEKEYAPRNGVRTFSFSQCEGPMPNDPPLPPTAGAGCTPSTPMDAELSHASTTKRLLTPTHKNVPAPSPSSGPCLATPPVVPALTPTESLEESHRKAKEKYAALDRDPAFRDALRQIDAMRAAAPPVVEEWVEHEAPIWYCAQIPHLEKADSVLVVDKLYLPISTKTPLAAQLDSLVDSYKRAVREIFEVDPKPYFTRNVTVSPLSMQRSLQRAVQRMTEYDIGPLSWAAWTMKKFKAEGAKKPPSIFHVFSDGLIDKWHGWWSDDADDEPPTRAVFTTLHKEQLYRTREARLRARGATGDRPYLRLPIWYFEMREAEVAQGFLDPLHNWPVIRPKPGQGARRDARPKLPSEVPLNLPPYFTYGR